MNPRVPQVQLLELQPEDLKDQQLVRLNRLLKDIIGELWGHNDALNQLNLSGSGTTPERPPTPPTGYRFWDTTLKSSFIWDGKQWVQSQGGAGTNLPIQVTDVSGLLLLINSLVSIARRINTTLPLTGGGDLSSDLTLDIEEFSGDTGTGGTAGTVPAPAPGDAAAGKVLGASGGWELPAAGGDLISIWVDGVEVVKGNFIDVLDGGFANSLYGGAPGLDGGGA